MNGSPRGCTLTWNDEGAQLAARACFVAVRTRLSVSPVTTSVAIVSVVAALARTAMLLSVFGAGAHPGVGLEEPERDGIAALVVDRALLHRPSLGESLARSDP